MSPKSDESSTDNDVSSAGTDPKQKREQVLRRDSSSKKMRRLSKACDSCSVRKVKCDAEGPPCHSCSMLGLPCTFTRPSRKRGPVNRRVAQLQRRQSSPGTAGVDSSSEFLTHVPTPRLGSIKSFPDRTAGSSPTVLSIESICPPQLAWAILNDFFIYLYPLHPFPHEPSFRGRLDHRVDLAGDKPFVALVASMIGAVVATYPRSPLRHLKKLGLDSRFPTSKHLFYRCQEVASEARGVGYLNGPQLGIQDAATSYFLHLMHTNVYRLDEAELYLSECLAILRMLGYHKPDRTQELESTSASGNLVEREEGRRLFWAVFNVVRPGMNYGDRFTSLQIPPVRLKSLLPSTPAEVDDEYIHNDRIDEQPQAQLSVIAGFNCITRLFLTHDPLVASDTNYAASDGSSPNRTKQQRTLLTCLASLSQIFANLPAELAAWPELTECISHDNADVYQSTPFSTRDSFRADNGRGSRRADRNRIAREVQKINIHVAFLASQSYFLERFWDISDGQSVSTVISMGNTGISDFDTADPDLDPWSLLRPGLALPSAVDNERYHIAHKLVATLRSVRPIHTEPGSVGLCDKIRQIMSTLTVAARSSGAATTPSTPGGSAAASESGAPESSTSRAFGSDAGAGATYMPVDPRTRSTRTDVDAATDPAQCFLQPLLNCLLGLEKRGAHAPLADTAQSADEPGDRVLWREEDDLRNWADLRRFDE